jgi:hypothetical protein
VRSFVAATGKQPREVVRRLRDIGCPMVMGHADAELLDVTPPAPETDEDVRRIGDISRWCAAQLDDADRAFLASFQPTVEISFGEERSLLCCHGLPRRYNDVMVATTSNDELDSMIAGHDATIIAGGHRHILMPRAYRGREFVNPGGVRLAYQFFPDGSVRVPPWAEFALGSRTDGGVVRVAFRRVPYDRDVTVRVMAEREMPHAAWWVADWR